MGYRLGVDLGTTFTAAAVRRADRIEMVTLGDRTVVAPSVVYAREDGILVTGDAAARRSVVDIGRLGREFKRRLGDPTPLMLGETPHSVASLLACLLRDVVRKVIDTEGEKPAGVLLTHPANWGPYRRELFGEVPRLAGLDTVRTVTEPEAAAAYYATERHLAEGDVIAVYDLGGGTFDATVVRTRAGGMEILGNPEGIERLGGVDFDEAVLAHVDHALGGAIGRLDPRDPRQATTLHRLRQDCIDAKEALSADDDTVIPVFLPNRHTEVKLSRGEFERMIRAPIDSTIEALRRAVASARVAPADLAAVVLVGGSSRIPLVARMISDNLGRPTAVDAHPKYAVALGAATLASPETLLPRWPATEAEQSPSPPRNYAAPALSGDLHDSYPATIVASPKREQVAVKREPVEETAPAGKQPPPPPRRPRLGGGKPRRRTMIALAAAVATVIGLLLAFTVFHVGGEPTSAPPPGPPPPVTSPAPATLAASLPTANPQSTIGIAGPQAIAVSPDGARMFVTSVGASKLTVLDTANGGTVASLFLPVPPQYVAVAPDGRHAYISCFPANGPDNMVAVLDTVSNTITATIPVGKHPYALAVTPAGHEVFVPHHDDATVSVIDARTNKVTATIPVKPNPHWVAFTPDGRTAYVSDHESNVVTVIDTTSRTIVTTVPVPTSPHSVAVAPDGRRMMETSYDAHSASVIDTAANKVVATIDVGRNPRSVAYAPDGRHAYVVNEGSNSLSVLDTTTNQVSATVPVGKLPVMVAPAPDGRFAYVTNRDSNEISVLAISG